MFDWFGFQQVAISFLIAFAAAGAFTLAFKLIYQWVTPYHERTLIREGNPAAAIGQSFEAAHSVSTAALASSSMSSGFGGGGGFSGGGGGGFGGGGGGGSF